MSTLTENNNISSEPSFWSDVKELVKFRLNLTVVASALLSYLLVAGGQVVYTDLLCLCFGGFFITGSANTLNQVLEKEYDALMTRTKNRPLPTNRISTSKAVLFAGLLALLGITLLGFLNSVSVFFGMLSLVLYAFVYTPLKRFSPIAVWVGAIPGALPVVIGAVAFNGYVSELAVVLFLIQFFWQLPHFWSIGWLSYDDYKRAGYKLLPVGDQVLDRRIGFLSLVWALPLVLLSLYPVIYGTFGIVSSVLILLVTFFYLYKCYLLFKKPTTEQAKSLMFTSFMYLPLVLLIFQLINL